MLLKQLLRWLLLLLLLLLWEALASGGLMAWCGTGMGRIWDGSRVRLTAGLIPGHPIHRRTTPSGDHVLIWILLRVRGLLVAVSRIVVAVIDRWRSRLGGSVAWLPLLA